MGEHKVTFVFEDGRTARIEADESDTIYIAALKYRIRIETDCREGTCATCKGLCTDGDYYMDDYIDEALTEDEAARREVLTCQMHVTSDCVIEFPYEAALALKGAPDTRPGKVAEIETVSSNVKRLVISLEDDSSPMTFLPGQYVHLGVPGTDAQRSYSFANSGGYCYYIFNCSTHFNTNNVYIGINSKILIRKYFLYNSRIMNILTS